MDQTSIKCPQCGASHVEHITQNKYSCPYCGHTFYIEGGQSEFVKQETDEFKISQQIEREEFKRKLKQNQKNKLIYALIGCILFIPAIFIIIKVIFFFDDKFSDKYLSLYDNNDKYALVDFLEAAPFECDGEICEFSNFAQTAQINGVEQKVSFLKIGEETYTLYTNSDSTIAYIKLGDKKFERPIKNYGKIIFDFKDEEELRKYLCEKSFEFMGDKYTFKKDGYSVDYNNQPVSNFIEYEFHNNGIHIYGAGQEPIESRATIGIHHQGGIDVLYLMMDEKGNNAYLLQGRTNKKFKRLN